MEILKIDDEEIRSRRRRQTPLCVKCFTSYMVTTSLMSRSRKKRGKSKKSQNHGSRHRCYTYWFHERINSQCHNGFYLPFGTRKCRSNYRNSRHTSTMITTAIIANFNPASQSTHGQLTCRGTSWSWSAMMLATRRNRTFSHSSKKNSIH